MAAREGASTTLTPDVLESKLTEGLKATFVQVSVDKSVAAALRSHKLRTRHSCKDDARGHRSSIYRKLAMCFYSDSCFPGCVAASEQPARLHDLPTAAVGVGHCRAHGVHTHVQHVGAVVR